VKQAMESLYAKGIIAGEFHPPTGGPWKTNNLIV
jgi:hypothetical protein